MDARVYFGKIHIIEWLEHGDARTGRELFEEVQPMGILSKPEVEVALHTVTGRAEFVSTLRAVEDDFRATGRLPLLQLETHGIYLTDPTLKC
jgi:hypothetical protein